MSRAFLMKKGTPESIMQRLEKAFKYVYDVPEFKAFNKKRRVDPDSWRDRKAYKGLLESQWKTATPVVKELGWTKK
jgi:tripartite-type tricarboxylate transporter receptor subunit TctC